MFGKSKQNKYNIDVATAGKMLENVFAACDTTPNNVPIDKLILRSKQNLFTDNLYIIIASVLFVITFCVPLFFPPGSFFVSVDSAQGRPLSVVEHTMEASTFSISFDGALIDVSSSYMIGADESVILASEYDRNTNTIVFPYEPQEYNIYVYDINGRCIHLLLSPHK